MAAKASVRRGPEFGRRRPVHVGTRLIGAETVCVVVAVPVVRGEVVERVAIDCLNVTTTAETNVDQPPIFVTAGYYTPIDFINDTIGAATLDYTLERMLAVADSEYLGGEPNVSGNKSWGAGRAYGQQFFKRAVIGDPMNVGKDGLGNADARFIDRFRTVVNRPIEVHSNGMLLLGGWSPRLDAQTSFGVADLDASNEPQETLEGYTNPTSSQSGQTEKATELFYGGDNYIEADSFKETQRRCFMIVRPQIARSAAILRGWS